MAGLFARLFPPVVGRVQRLYSASPWRRAAVVREAVAQFLQQMIHLLPGEHLIGLCEDYTACSLRAMETVQELGKLVRLLDQLVNKIGARGVAASARVLPMVWDKILSAGALSAGSPVVQMGVVSESARETIEVYRHFFHLLCSIGSWGCAPALLLLPPPYLDSMLAQLSCAILAPAEVELPKFALQALARLSQELLAGPGVEGLSLDPDAAATFAANRRYFRACLLERVLPATLQAVLRPGFNLGDAKNFILIGEVGQFLKALCAEPFGEDATALSDAALQAIYKGLKGHCQASPIKNGFSSAGPPTEDPIMAFCILLREKPRFNSALKHQLRTLLAAGQQAAF
ncbi:unnamed protein product [Phytomonas sp. Hart1]|nr:unnamed protein product [Phytomonas sp. Hart1]|eukprot:CCW72347.1 unnamed protein product [Phytomonas sp. isolate Hart1]